MEVPDLPVIMFDFLPELQQQFTPLFHQETAQTSQRSRHYIFLVYFSYMEWRGLMLQVKAELHTVRLPHAKDSFLSVWSKGFLQAKGVSLSPVLSLGLVTWAEP